jgi:hypothetical protein
MIIAAGMFGALSARRENLPNCEECEVDSDKKSCPEKVEAGAGVQTLW